MKLSDIATVQVGFPFKSEQFNTVGEGVRLVRGKNVTTRSLRWGEDTRWWKYQNPELNTYLLKDGDIVIGMDGSRVGQNFARVHKDDLPLYLVQRVACIRAKKGYNQDFIWQCIASDYFTRYVESIKTGSAIPHISGKQICDFEIPDLNSTQMSLIGKILTSIDRKISINSAINKKLYSVVMLEFQKQFIDNPTVTEKKPLYGFADYINGAAFKPDEYSDAGLPIIKIAELKNGITESTQFFMGAKDSKYLVFNGDILFSWSGNPDTSIDIFIWADGDGILNQHTFNVKAYHNHKWFVYLMLKWFKPQFAEIARNKQTTGLGHVTAADLKRLEFIYDEKSIIKFESEISPLMETYYRNEIEKRKLANLRDSLLPRLMSGELDISNVEI